MLRLFPPLALILALAVGCGEDPTAPPERSATEHNAADVAFASEMLQHHAQALSMVDLTLDRPLDPAVQQLAEDVRAGQGPEIQTFSEWLTDWDEPVPETMRDHVNAGHGDEHAPEELTALSEATDSEFQGLWLAMMIEHHEGAVEMAQAEIDEGRFQQAVELAGDIVETQSAEIEVMQGLSPS